MDMRTEKRGYYRLDLESLPPLVARLKSPGDSPRTTQIKDLSAGGFSCILPDAISIRKTDLVYMAFVLPFEHPESVQTKAFLVAMTGDSRSRVLRFRFADYQNKRKQDILHRFIVSKKFEMLRTAENRVTWQTGHPQTPAMKIPGDRQPAPRSR